MFSQMALNNTSVTTSSSRPTSFHKLHTEFRTDLKHHVLSKSVEIETNGETQSKDLNVPIIDDHLDIHGWFSKPIYLPNENDEYIQYKKNYLWIVLKSIAFRWNWLYNTYTIAMKTILFICYFIVGVLFYNSIEGWSVMSCVYFITGSITTIGLSDFYPTTETSRLFSIPYLLVGCTIMFNIFITFARTYITDCQDEIIYQIQRLRGKHASPVIRSVEMSFYRVMISIIFVSITALIGTLFYSSSEGWTFVYALYYSTVMVMFSIGYGMI
jgi:hypothetical protein